MSKGNKSKWARLRFFYPVFARFKLYSIKIKSFNNHYKDGNICIQCLRSFVETLNKLCRCTADIFSDNGMKKFFRLHKITYERFRLLEKILLEYGFTQEEVNNMIEGEQLYQLEVCGAVRIIFERQGEQNDELSFLFFDTNHHIYTDEARISDSMNYKFCPEKNQDKLKSNEIFCGFKWAVEKFVDRQAWIS